MQDMFVFAFIFDLLIVGTKETDCFSYIYLVYQGEYIQ